MKPLMAKIPVQLGQHSHKLYVLNARFWNSFKDLPHWRSNMNSIMRFYDIIVTIQIVLSLLILSSYCVRCRQKFTTLHIICHMSSNMHSISLQMNLFYLNYTTDVTSLPYTAVWVCSWFLCLTKLYLTSSFLLENKTSILYF